MPLTILKACVDESFDLVLLGLLRILVIWRLHEFIERDATCDRLGDVRLTRRHAFDLKRLDLDLKLQAAYVLSNVPAFGRTDDHSPSFLRRQVMVLGMLPEQQAGARRLDPCRAACYPI